MDYIGKGKWIFYGGARGGGKSFLALAAAVIASLQFPKLKTVVIRTTYAELEGVFIDKIQEVFPPKVFKYTFLASKNKAVFDNGSI